LRNDPLSRNIQTALGTLWLATAVNLQRMSSWPTIRGRDLTILMPAFEANIAEAMV